MRRPASAEDLGHTVIAAEDFGASQSSPQQVCLAAVREADIVGLLLGERHGIPQTSGLSPAHEEYRYRFPRSLDRSWERSGSSAARRARI